MIGDLRTAALVSTRGTIDFLCLPEFDSATIFASLLDAERGGYWSIAPSMDGARVEQRYLRDTNVLVTRFITGTVEMELIDFLSMQRRLKTSRIVRNVRMVRGAAAVRCVCVPRFDYARAAHRVEIAGDTAMFTGTDGTTLRLTGLRARRQVLRFAQYGDANADVTAEVPLKAGDRVCFLLEQIDPRRAPRAVDDCSAQRAMRQTIVFWRRWIAPTRHRGEWSAAVRRSALTLKLLQSRRTGGIIAAPTFGLPEEIGGDRNWDFRYAWIRDSSFIAIALGRLDLWQETRAFKSWIIERCEAAPSPDALQSLYRLDGTADVSEATLEHLAGYRHSRPVRIGNAAFDQLQLDIFGELVEALYRLDEHNEPTSRALWRHLERLTNWVCQNWRRPDQGIWEVRGGGQEFLFSRIMCWVAVDRALRIASRRRYGHPPDEWRRVRHAIRSDVETSFWSEKLSAFVGTLRGETIDAACLAMPLVGFIGPLDPRWLSTLRAVETRLVRDGLVRRYDMTGMDTEAGSLTAPSFTICSFWYVECLALAGEWEKAGAAMQRLMGHANHVGIFAEDLGVNGEQLGNFPQGLPHAALIGAASALAAMPNR